NMKEVVRLTSLTLTWAAPIIVASATANRHRPRPSEASRPGLGKARLHVGRNGMRRLAFVLFVAVMGVAMAQDPIIIGVNLELSGRMTVTGNDTPNGIQVAHMEQDSVLDRPIQLSICDNASTPEG